MFTWLGAKIAAILSTYVLGVVSSLMAAITPIALSAMTLWVLLYGWAVLRNEVPESVQAFVWKVSKRYAAGELDEARGGPATWLGKKIG